MKAFAFNYVATSHWTIVFVLTQHDPPRIFSRTISNMNRIHMILDKMAKQYKWTEIEYVPGNPLKHSELRRLIEEYENYYQIPLVSEPSVSREGLFSSKERGSGVDMGGPAKSGFERFQDWRRGNS